jgi:CubicO group peptidase (beta-lactamase class C family)
MTEGLTADLFLTTDFATTFKTPLIFAPGEGWEYSSGIDWAGLMVERVSGLSLENYLKKNVWGPLGVESMTFFPNKDPKVSAKLADLSLRAGGITMMGTAQDPNGSVKHTDDTVWNKDIAFCSGGAGCYGAPLDYQKLLHSLCVGDGKVLKNSTLDIMFQDHLTPEAKAAFNASLQIPEMRAICGVDEGQYVSYGLGGMIFLEDVDGGRKAGTLNWGGYPNLIWFCDRKSGLSGIMGSQIVPPGDLKIGGLMKEWEQALYKRAGKA